MEETPGISLFQASALNIDNVLQNQEDEDIEEQKRRQEEIQNFLSAAMDEFNYDDQSSRNSTNVSMVEQSNPHNDSLVDKYKNAGFDDQLKVLYEVRVREVKELTEKLERMHLEIEKQRNVSTKKIILLEAEKDKAQISLKQAQALLVGKNDEIAQLSNESYHLKSTVAELEKKVQSVNDEFIMCKQSNKDLTDQLAIMHNGLTTNTISDRQILEQHHSELSQLHHLLDVANTKLYRKERECKEYESKLKETIHDKDCIVTEKSSVINKLTESLENAQQQCQDLLEIIEKLSNENKTLKLSASRSNELQESTRIMGLTEKIEYINALQKELGKAYEKLNKQQSECENLQETCKVLTEDCNRIETEKQQYKLQTEKWKGNFHSLEKSLKNADDEIQNIQKEIETYKGKLEIQRNDYEEKILLLQDALSKIKNNKTEDNAVQVSICQGESKIEEVESLKENLAHLLKENYELKVKWSQADDQISKLQIAAKLEKDREILIKTLQEKAAQFEKIIKERQQKPICFSIGVNTDQQKDSRDLLKTKYEVDLVNKEVELRVELKNEFDQRLEKIEQELAKKLLHRNDRKCSNCEELSNKLKKLEVVTYNKDQSITGLKMQMKQDRNAVATLLESWRDKFMVLETEKKDLTAQNLEMRNYCNELMIRLKRQDAGTSKLYEVIKKECEETIKLWNKNMKCSLEKYTIAQKRKVSESLIRIDQYSESVDVEVQAIEMEFLNSKQNFEQFRFLRP